MAGTKITDLPVSNTAENANLIANVNGQATQIPASTVGAQPDWNETDETKPSFILNKPEIKPGYTHYILSKCSYSINSANNPENGFFVIYKGTSNPVYNIETFVNDYKNGPVFFDRVDNAIANYGSQCLHVGTSGIGYPVVYVMSNNGQVLQCMLAYRINGGDVLS